jgi:hypothetical protein
MSLQPLWAQATAAELFRVPDGDRQFRKWISDTARAEPTGWREVWRRSRAMGECLAPFLRHALITENNPRQRLVLTGANLLATADARSILLHDQIADRPRYRIMAELALALGPRQSGEGLELQRRIKRAGSPLEQVTACMALSRFADRQALPSGVFEKAKDSGILAAALYCSPVQSRAWIEGRLRRFAAVEYSGLVWRGYLLGARRAGTADKQRRELAQEVLRDARRGLLAAAAWYLAGDPGAMLSDAELLAQPLGTRLLLARSAGLRARLVRAADPGLRGTADRVELRRWAVLLVRSAPMARIAAALRQWQDELSRDPELRGAVCLGLAWRLATQELATAAASGLALGKLDETVYGPWLQLARGVERTGGAVRFTAPELVRAYPLARAGRLSRAGLADLLDAALWRTGDHPALAGLDLHRQFLGEVAIDGSEEAGTRFANPMGREVYIAKGLSREDNLFKVAFELFKFIRQSEPWSRAEYRLGD